MKLNRPMQALLLIVVSTSTAATSHAEKTTAKRPNILFIIADQWRTSAFGHTGNRDVKTPTFDRLAKESFHFFNAVAGCPVCCPTRASLMTGQRPLTNGVFMNDVSLDPKAVTIAKVLVQAGYETGYIGKWHLDGHGRSAFIPRERRQGFGYWKVLECTHNYNRSFYYADGPQKLLWNGYDAFAQSADAQQYLRDHAETKKPFALFVSWGPPHAPYHTAPQKYRDMYDPARIHTRPNVPGYLRSAVKRDLAGYYAHCTAVDHTFSELWNTLKETGLEENTILVFTSDHGDLLGSHNYYKKQQPYDECARVPMLIHFPRVLGRKPRRLEAPINTEDVMPTLLGLCGIDIPKTVEGINYSGYLRGGKNPSDNVTLLTCPMPFGQWSRRWGGREWRGVRTLRYTYTRSLRGPWLLFDNKKDPYQLNNLVGQPEHAALQTRLESILQAKLKQSDDKFLPGMVYVKQWGYPLNASGTVPYRN